MKNKMLAYEILHQLIKETKNDITITEINTKEFMNVRKKGFVFKVRQFIGKGIGNISTMNVSIFLMMRIITFVVTPLEKEAPLLSVDVIAIGKKRRVYIEYYNCSSVRDNFKGLIRLEHNFKTLNSDKEHWYDSLLLKNSSYFITTEKYDNEMLLFITAVLKQYIKYIVNQPNSSVAKYGIENYVNELLQHGGPSTNIFIKLFGEEKTRELYNNILFNTNCNNIF